MQVPSFLSVGDTICLVAPAGIVTPKEMQACQLYLEEAGFKVETGEFLLYTSGRFSGTDEQRLYDLQWALDHPFAKAVLCARGGYGLSRIIDKLDWRLFKLKPKWVIGYSDITLLLSSLFKLNIHAIHGPMGKSMGNADEQGSVQLLFNTLSGIPYGYSFEAHPLNIPGNASGRLTGGNITMLCNALGTASDVDFDGCLLFIEDLDEQYYHLDRLLTQLWRAGKLKGIAGIIAGDFIKMNPGVPAFGGGYQEIITRFAELAGVPLVLNFPAGHGPVNVPLMMGAEYTLESGPLSCKLYPVGMSDRLLETGPFVKIEL